MIIDINGKAYDVDLPVSFEDLCEMLDVRHDITMVYVAKNKDGWEKSGSLYVGKVLDIPDAASVHITAVHTGNA